MILPLNKKSHNDPVRVTNDRKHPVNNMKEHQRGELNDYFSTGFYRDLCRTGTKKPLKVEVLGFWLFEYTYHEYFCMFNARMKRAILAQCPFFCRRLQLWDKAYRYISHVV